MTGTRAAWNPVARELFAAAGRRRVVVWRVPEGGRARRVNVLDRHSAAVGSLAWMPDGRRLVCVSADGRAVLWDALDGTFLADVSSLDAHCTMAAVSPQGLVATAGADGMVVVGHPDGGWHQLALRHYDSAVECCAWSRSGHALAVGCDDGTVDLLAPRLTHLRTLSLPDGTARTLRWAPDDASLAVRAADGTRHVLAVGD
ncbi:WD40 repeat domain-containing protein [Streptomyces gamaensis]|uniref:WD40 repeat domain-containing protein n=1 Tax=Streptomyces gamaensis TaxID=1763542 RepID=A0ABW0Z964_9ACTN